MTQSKLFEGTPRKCPKSAKIAGKENIVFRRNINNYSTNNHNEKYVMVLFWRNPKDFKTLMMLHLNFFLLIIHMTLVLPESPAWRNHPRWGRRVYHRGRWSCSRGWAPPPGSASPTCDKPSSGLYMLQIATFLSMFILKIIPSRARATGSANSTCDSPSSGLYMLQVEQCSSSF